MWKLAGFLGLGLVVGFAVASLSNRGTVGSSAAAEYSATALEQRIADMETRLADARRERRELEEQIMDLQVALVETGSVVTDVDDDLVDRQRFESGIDEVQAAINEGRRPRFRLGERRFDNESLMQEFIEAGIAPDRAQWIIDRTDELRMETLQARYEAQRDGVPLQLREGMSVDETLRTELGDADYEKYLTATNRPTSVAVGSVLASSPAERAGLQPGDQVISYAGQRVFNMAELNRLTFEGQTGENVAVDVLRDGQPIQLYLPRGPIGITGGSRFRR